jgi:hypothetical protein
VTSADPEGQTPPAPTEEDLLVLYLGQPADRGHIQRMVGAGGRIVPARNPYWERWGITIADPDGYRLVLSHRIRPRRSDLSRRTFLRAGLLGSGAAGLYVATGWAVRLSGLPGAARRFTGSYETGSFDPNAMPDTIWLEDSVPAIDPDRWQLTVVDDAGRYELRLDDLSAFDARMRATLDCTSGWYAHQDWNGVPVSALLRSSGQARSLLVHSVTGYWIRVPVRDVRAENPVHGPGQLSCSPSRPAVMITDHVPAVRLPVPIPVSAARSFTSGAGYPGRARS